MHDVLLTPMTTSRFSFQDFAKVFSLSIGLSVLFVGIFSFFPAAGEFLDGLHPSISFVIAYVIQLAVLFFPLWFFLVDKKGATLKDFGFKKIPWVKAVLNTVGIYCMYIAVALAIGLIVFYSGWDVPGYGAQESYLPLFGEDWIGISVGALFVIFIAPILEEVFFRGFIYRIFIKVWPVWLGSALTAAIFAFMHLQLVNFVPLFIVGLFMNWSYQRTGSLWTSIGFHMLNNTVAFGVTLYFHYHPELIESLPNLF